MNSRQATLLGIGVISEDAYNAAGGEMAATGTTTPAGKSGWDKFIEIFSAAGDIATNIIGNKNTQPYYGAPPPAPAMSAGTKALLIGAAVAAVGTGVYFATRKKKK